MIDYYFGKYLITYLNKSTKELTDNKSVNKKFDICVGLVATKYSYWLPLVIKNIIHKINNCKLYFFGSKETISSLKNDIDYNIFYYLIDDINSIKDYNKLLLNKSFWNIFQQNKILITQPDCILLRDIIPSDLYFDYNFHLLRGAAG